MGGVLCLTRIRLPGESDTDWQRAGVCSAKYCPCDFFLGMNGIGRWRYSSSTRQKLCETLCLTHILAPWGESVFEHDGELASDSVPFAHRVPPFCRCSIQRQTNQSRGRFVAREEPLVRTARLIFGFSDSMEFAAQTSLCGLGGWQGKGITLLRPGASPMQSPDIAWSGYFLERRQSGIGVQRCADRLEGNGAALRPMPLAKFIEWRLR